MSGVLDALRGRFERVAIVHEWLTIPGGSEQVLLALLQMFRDAELFASIYAPGPWPAEIEDREVHASFLNRIPGASRNYRALLPLMSSAYRSFDFSGFDLVLSSSHAMAKNVLTPPSALHVCYCHTPIRYAWEESFLEEEQVSAPVRMLLPLLMAHLRRQDLKGSANPDAYVANSNHVAARIERYYGRQATVVHPPVEVESLLSLPREPEDFYLVFGRVVPYKRVDLALAACERLGRRLYVAGDGRALPALREAHAGSRQVSFLERVSDEERRRLLSKARALLFPGEEDFGIVPVEAQAAGLPVIAYGVGGAKESVIDAGTGVLFGQQSVESLIEAIERFEGMTLDPDAARANARAFDVDRFEEEMAGAIADAWSRREARS